MNPAAQCLTEEAYFAFKRERGAVSQSELKAFIDDPEAWHLGKRLKPSKSLRWGSLVDCLLLYPEQFGEIYAVHEYPREDKRNKEYASWLEKIEEKGLQPLKKSVLLDAGKTLRAVCMSSGIRSTLFSGGERVEAAAMREIESRDEQMPFGQDGSPSELMVAISEEKTFTSQLAVACTVAGVTFAAKLDIVPDAGCEYGDWLFDLKTTAYFNARDYEKQAAKLRYQMQSASYLDAFNAASGQERSRFAHIVCEVTFPFRSVLLPVSEHNIATGRREYHDALAYFLHCKASGDFPGPFSATTELDIPEWYSPYQRPPGVAGLSDLL